MFLSRGIFLMILSGAFLLVFSPMAAFADDDQPDELPDPHAIDGPDMPSLMGDGGNDNDETPGEWIEGDTPSNLKDDAPVLLFVPGLNNVAQVFIDDNDMYETAYDAGYQTAFIQLYDAGGESADMWDNGELLAEKINEISEHFDDKPITVVAYSKGGVDTQTALAHYGAWEDVENVITLSSPHEGSQLADLAYSSWAGWLADLLGSRGDGTYSMQTGEMEDFRSEIEEEEHATTNDYYTLGGDGWSSGSSSIRLGGMYLDQYGSNDGVVTAENSALPGGKEIEIGDWTHSTVRTGDTFPVFEDYLTSDGSSGHASPDSNHKAESDPSANQWVHGGPLAAEDDNTVTIPVEDDVNEATFNLMTADSPDEIRLIDPSGDPVDADVETVQSEDGYFPGAYNTVIQQASPEAGEWDLKLPTEEDSAYLLTVDYDTDLQIKSPKVAANEMEWHDNQTLDYQLEADSSQVEASSLETVYRISDTKNPENTRMLTAAGKEGLNQSLPLEKADTVYNLTIDVSGKTKSGELFKRTIIDSIYTSGKTAPEDSN